MSNPVYIKAAKIISHPLEKVWQTVAVGFGNVADYNPGIKASNFDSITKEGIGTRRHCDTKDGGYLKEEIIKWNESNFFKLKLIDTSFPISLIESKFSFSNEGNHTKLTQEFWYRMKPPMGWLSGLMKGKMRKTLENGLEGLDYFLTNEGK